jgi:uncharacterized protein YbbC (DUF1343 family)
MNIQSQVIPATRTGISRSRSQGPKFQLLPALALWCGLIVAFAAPGRSIESFAGSADSFDTGRLHRIDELVEEAIREGDLPGAVVLVGRHGRIHYRKAFGHRSLVPSAEPMTLDTVFDIASLTKVVATTSSIMLLAERGRIRLNDPVAGYIPNFKRHGKGTITLRHLLSHTSGLRPGLNPKVRWTGYSEAIARAVEDVPVTRPGRHYVYSDLNFILLGEIVRRVGGMPLDRFAHDHLFEPLGMRDTMFNPPAALRSRIAPTERCWARAQPCGGPDGTMLRGMVQDRTARRMGGVAGHAGLFSSADDLALFCRMLIGTGAPGKKQVLSPLTIATMISPATPLGESTIRGLGWSLDSTQSANRGEFLHLRPFGHTGFTGSSLWLDPVTGLYVIFLSNRLHPDGKGDVIDLRTNVATIAASALSVERPVSRLSAGNDRFKLRLPQPPRGKPAQHPTPVLAGIDVLRDEKFVRLRGRRVGLLTNHTGRSRSGVPTIDLIRRARDVQLVALFSPEHGIRGTLNRTVPSSRDPETGLVIHSLYRNNLRPTAKMLEGIDTMVVDLQDVGVRFYTYATTVAYVMEEAARRKIAVVVLDRPNPLNGYQIEGPTLDQALLGFTGYFPMPIRHGMSMGELAQLFKGENRIGVKLSIVKMQNWRRDFWFDETGLPWVNPSPNLRNLIQVTLYPGIEAIEGTNISVGRGTDTPFEQIGAPWIDGIRLASKLNARGLSGVRFYPVSFTPASSRFAGKVCRGVFILVTDRQTLRPVHVGLEIAAMLNRMYPDDYPLDTVKELMGSAKTLARVKAGEDPARTARSWMADETHWRRLREPYLLY